MDAIEAIMTRKSIRNYTDRAITDEELDIILRAGMSGPSCVNAREWDFIVVRDNETLNKMADANGRPADPVRGASVGILICGNLQRSFKPAPDYWIIDGAIAGQNMTIAATALGIGSVWLGTYPQMERVEAQKKLFNLPEHIIPHSLIAFGYPDTSAPERRPGPPGERAKYEPEKIHFEKW